MSDKKTEAAEILSRSDFEDECTDLIQSTESGFYSTPNNIKSGLLIGELYERQVSILSTTIAQLREENERLKNPEWQIVDKEQEPEESGLIHFQSYWIVVKETGKVRDAVFCDWQTEGIDNTWIIYDEEYPLSYATHFMIYYAPPPPTESLTPKPPKIKG